jgi:hypothetical protein
MKSYIALAFEKRGLPFTKQTLILTDKISLTANPQRILQATVGFFFILKLLFLGLFCNLPTANADSWRLYGS